MWFRRKAKADPATVARGLRDQAFQVTAADIGLAQTPDRRRVWGVLIETGYATAVATLAAFADGTTSLYFSSGGGVIGAGEHAAVRDAAARLLTVAEKQFEGFAATSATPLPAVGRVRFYLRTDVGVLTAEADEQDLGHGRHALSPLFHAAHAVITAVRETSERQGV